MHPPAPPTPTRVLHVNKFLYRRGGAEGYMLDLADHQRRRGHEVRLFGMQHPENDADGILGPLPSHAEFEPPPPGASARVRLAARMIWSREVRRCFAAAVRAWRPDVIHCHNVYHQLSPSFLAEAAEAGIPVVLTMHDYKLVCPTYHFLDKGELCTACVAGGPWQAARRACKDGSRAASGIASLEVWLHRRLGAYDPVGRFVSPSRFLAGQVLAAGVYPDRVVHLDNFTDVAGVVPAAAPGSGAVYAGRLSAEKGVDVLVRAVGTLGRAGSAGGPLLDVAGDGPERPALERLAAEVAPGLVRFHGRLDRASLTDLVRRRAVSVVPSVWHENQPLSVLESFALGVPVLATDLGGLPDVVTPGRTGWLVPAADVGATAAALDAALSDPAAAHALGRQARREAEARFSPEEHLRGLDDLYSQVLTAQEGLACGSR